MRTSFLWGIFFLVTLIFAFLWFQLPDEVGGLVYSYRSWRLKKAPMVEQRPMLLFVYALIAGPILLLALNRLRGHTNALLFFERPVAASGTVRGRIATTLTEMPRRDVRLFVSIRNKGEEFSFEIASVEAVTPRDQLVRADDGSVTIPVQFTMPRVAVSPNVSVEFRVKAKSGGRTLARASTDVMLSG